MKNQLIISGAIALALGSLSACVAQDPVSLEIGNNIQPVYTAPDSYADHRNQQQLLETDDGNIAFTDHGSGPVIVLLHGVPTSSWMYRKVVPLLQDDMRVITVDFLGYGSSDKPEDGGETYSAAAQARRVQAVLDHVQVEDHALLMHDMGGLVAWEMLAAEPETVSHLVVLNTIVSETGFNRPNLKAGAVTRQITKAYTGALTSVAILENTFKTLGLTGKHKLTEAECFGYVAPMREGSNTALYSFFTTLDSDMLSELDQNNDEMLPRYQGETLVLWGANDDVLTAEQIPILQERLNIPDQNIHIFDDTAHFIAEERPDDIAREVKAFVGIGD